MTRDIRSTAVATALALTLAAPLAAHAADAMRVVLDPNSGELRSPTAAEALAFQKAEAALRASQAQPGARGAVTTAPKRVGGIEIRYPDGTVENTLGDDTMLTSVVSERPDGSLAFDCLPAAQANKYVKATAAKKSLGAKTVSVKTAAK